MNISESEHVDYVTKLSQRRIEALKMERAFLYPNQTVEEVGKLFLSHQDLQSMAVVDNKIPVGIVHRYQLMDIFLSAYGRDLHGKKPIMYFMDTAPLVVEADLPVETGSQYITDNMQQTVIQEFIITKNQHYIGMGSLLDLLKTITALQIDQLEQENKRLSAEVEITCRLQQMLLPKEQELTNIEDLEIAGFMEPADEVGGDYYDVLQHQGLVKIGIGDVTGHGLESGVLSLMVQTAVRTLLINDITDPVTFLDVLNRTIYANIERMQVEKELTLLIVDYFEGKLRISGQHEHVVLVRNGKVELIDTMDLGFPIGLEESIEQFISHTEIVLQADDVVLLYTDGIPEAENKNGEYYSIERMCDIVQQHWQKPVHEIREMLLADVYAFIDGYTVLDDITLLVLKQK
ncbi:SpoIIE family protein phosphatase [Candidatus Albibeggiatoa sp. nov. NOAA]|uniref:SpoIIE family protein phosphatase n=1 Tax=Candidatus Albibeggiatoa sp. nov. NOAA TaxID=3162724 RepID=UPI0032FB25BB|nr:SpoIIE family protein phosphatase [Thiotrichaceae bacterium]